MKMSRLQRQGLAYERDYGKYATRANPAAVVVAGQWFEFEDANGLGWAQPDLLIFYPGLTIIAECKLTFRDWAVEQVLGLYAPLVTMHTKGPVQAEVVARYLVAEPAPPPRGLKVVQWLGGMDLPKVVRG